MGIKEKLEMPFKKKYEEVKSERTHKKFVADIREYSKREEEAGASERLGKFEAEERERKTMEEVRHPKPSLFQSLGSQARGYVKQELAGASAPSRKSTPSKALSQQGIFAPITQAPKQRGFVGVGDQSMQRTGGLSPMLEGAFFSSAKLGGGMTGIERAFSSQPTGRRSKKKKLLGRKPKYIQAFM